MAADKIRYTKYYNIQRYKWTEMQP